MTKGRLEAFSDGVVAILITIMVLELKVPKGHGWDAVHDLVPTISTYVLSYIFIGIYWNNHHHMLHVTERINGAVLWANLHLLFWLSLIPFVTGWMGETHLAPLPTASYAVVFLCAAIAYTILVRTILRVPGGNPRLAKAIGRDVKGYASLAIYAVAIPTALVSPAIAVALIVVVALIWLVPDRRIESALDE